MDHDAIGLGRIEGPIVGAVVFFGLQEWLADYGSAYLIALGLVTVAIVVLAPRGLWGFVVDHWPISLFATERSLRPVVPPVAVVEEGM